MKKIFLFFVSFLPIMANAYDVEIDGIYYNVTAKKAKVMEVTSGDSKYTGEVIIPASVEYNGETYGVTSIGIAAFYSCSGLTSVVIPNSVASIGKRAFYSCSGLTSVAIPNSVTSIGSDAFYNCDGLTSVHITDLAAWCKISFDFSYSNPLYFAHHLFLNGEEVTDLVIPNSVTTISDRAFDYCSGLTSVTIPESVTSIGEDAFDYCSGLTSVTIPNSVTSIGRYAFYGCIGLTSVTIPESVTTIGICVFSYCIGLTSVTIPESVTGIYSSAFYGCSGLTSVIISGQSRISSEAFSECAELTDVYCYTEMVPFAYSDAFKNSYIEYATLHVPAASIDAYKSHEPWSGFGKIVALTDEEVGIKDVISQEEGPAAIYTTDGKRVDTLQKGINIVKKGARTTKVLVK